MPLANFDPDPHATYRFSPKADRDTLVVVNFSGGGIRAAALSFGALKELDVLLGTGSGTLLDQVDIISSVSGGSVTAAWYALKGRAGLDPADASNPLWSFLYQDWTSDLAWRGLNPLSLAKYAFSEYSRSDVLADFFADELYGEASYAQILDRYRNDPHQPYVILNATDLGHETGFTFTQGQFDFLCSDLGRYRLADAVAASANFPLAFSATGIRNFSGAGCGTQTGKAWVNDGPPQWIDHYREFDTLQAYTAHSYQLLELRQARQAQKYIGPDQGDEYIHLLDGGLIDNLGIRSTLAIEDDPARVPGLYLRLGAARSDGAPVRPEGYQNIRHVLYVVVNARTLELPSIDRHEYPPGAGTTIEKMIFTQLDNSILDDESYLTAELEATANRAPPAPGERPGTPPFLSDKPAAKAKYPAPAGTSGLGVHVVAVDFDMIPDPKCREYYWTLGTNWGLKGRQITALIELAKVLISRSPDLVKFYEEIGKPNLAPPPLDFGGVCDLPKM